MQQDEITFKIIGCAMKVHNTLGNGFQEVIYQRCFTSPWRVSVKQVKALGRVSTHQSSVIK